MAKERLKWLEWMGYQMGSKPQINYNGREPFAIDDAEYRAMLLTTGVFEQLAGNQMRYVGGASLAVKNGGRIHVDADGFYEFETNDFDQDDIKRIRKISTDFNGK